MPIQVTCPACGKALRVPDNLIGQRVKCPGCTEQFTATNAGAPLDAPPPPRPERPPEAFRPAEGEILSRRAGESEPRESDRFQEEDSPRRGNRPPRYDDYEDDDEDYGDAEFERRQSRRRRRDREAALARVSGPGNGLLAVGIIGIVLSVLGMGLNIVNLANARGGGAEGMIALNLGLGVFHIVMSVLIIVGANKMKALEGYGLAKAAAIIAMIPFISPCCLLGLIFGIQSLNALGDQNVKDAFDSSPVE